MTLDTILSLPDRYTVIRNGPSAAEEYSAANFQKGCGWTVFRFIADNPGFWHFHCHLDWDMATGMGLVLEVAPEVLWDDWKLKLPDSYELCGAIDSQTPNPRAQAEGSGSTSSANDKNTLLANWSLTEVWLILIVPSALLCALLLGVMWYVRVLLTRMHDMEVKYKHLDMESTHNSNNGQINPLTGGINKPQIGMDLSQIPI
jgi:hypothetical protein